MLHVFYCLEMMALSFLDPYSRGLLIGWKQPSKSAGFQELWAQDLPLVLNTVQIEIQHLGFVSVYCNLTHEVLLM